MALSKSIFSLGIDAGGSKTRAYGGFAGPKPSNQFIGAGANPSRIGFDASLNIFKEAISELWEDKAEQSDINLVMGVAGIEGAQLVPKMESNMLAYLNERSPGNKHSCRCMTDIMLIGAIDLRKTGGLSIILGTGSSFYFHDLEGNPHQGGGWGHILGDEGSGYGISRRALQHFMRMTDGQVEDDFTLAFLSKIGGKGRPDVVNYVYQDRDNFHHLVRWVVEQSESGDRIASKLIKEEIEALVERIIQFVEDRKIEFAEKIILNGGLAKNPHMHEIIAQVIGTSALSSCSIRCSDMEPAEGAWQLGLEKTP